MFAFEFPPINEILRWQDIFPGFNKIALIAVAATVISVSLFLIAARQDYREAPTGTRNLAEISVEFIEENIIMQTMGRDGLGWTPFLLSLFLFIYLCNVPGIIPIPIPGPIAASPYANPAEPAAAMFFASAGSAAAAASRANTSIVLFSCVVFELLSQPLCVLRNRSVFWMCRTCDIHRCENCKNKCLQESDQHFKSCQEDEHAKRQNAERNQDFVSRFEQCF